MKFKLAFSDMWGFENYQFNPRNNYFYDLLSSAFSIKIVDELGDPDLLIYSVFGNNYKKYDCKKILFSGENYPKDKIPNHYNDADLVLSHYETQEKEVFFPLWVLFINWFEKSQPMDLPCNPTYLINLGETNFERTRFLKKDRKFCAFINNNPIADREELFHKLNNLIPVDSLGMLHNNSGSYLRGHEGDKINALLNYKFTIAFENSYHPGYNTEKIIQPFAAGCIPLYSGGERVFDYFNKDAFLYFDKREETVNDYIKRIIEVHSNETMYKEMVLEQPLKYREIMHDFDLKKIKKVLLSI